MPIATATLVGALLLGLALAPTPTLAAPAIALAPAAIPRGGTTTVTGTGFAPGAPLALFLALPQFAGARVRMADLVAGADGTFATTIRLNGFGEPVVLPVIVGGGGTDLAQATLTLTAAPAIAPERVTVTPSAGPAGTRFAATGTGLTPGIAVVAFTTESAKGPAGNFRPLGTFTVPADGRVAFPIDTTGYDPQGYDLIVFGPGGPRLGLPLAIAQFTVAPADDPVAVYRRFIDARNRYDLDATLALVTDDIQFVGAGAVCTAAHPCVGKEAFRTDMQGAFAAHVQNTIVGMPQVVGTTVRARLELRADNLPAAGVERIIIEATTEVRDGKIASTRTMPDASDPQTAQFLDYQRTHQPPAPGTMPGLPNTGGGGLATRPLGDAAGLLGGGALLGALLLAATVRRRAKRGR